MAFLIRIIIEADFCYKVIAEENEEIKIGNGPKFDVCISKWENEQLKLCIKKGLLQISGKKIPDLKKCAISQSEFATQISSQKNISINWMVYFGESNQKFDLPYRGIVTVGRTDKNLIQLKNGMISSTHLTFHCDNGSVRVEDGNNGKASSNRTFLNGKRLTTAILQSGDVLDLVNVRIKLVKTSLIFYQVNNILVFNQAQGDYGIKDSLMSEPIYRRSPRIRESMPQQEIILAKAPSKGAGFQKRRGMFSSLLSSGAMLGASVATGMVSPALLAARAAGLVAPVANIAIGSSDNKKNKKIIEKKEQERRQKYGSYIDTQRARIIQAANQQRTILKKENPTIQDSISFVQNLHPKLWERSPNDSDFLDIRIGMGYENLCVPVKTPATAMGFQTEVDETELMAQQIVDETRIVDDVPSRISLKQYGTIGVIGKRNSVIGLLKNMLISMTSAHYYEDVRIIGIFDKAEQDIWSSMRWLPHVWDEEKQSRFLAFDEVGVERIDDTFYEIIQQRLNAQQEYNQKAPLPHYIFILGSYELMKKSKLLSVLLNNSPAAGATTIFAYNIGNKDSQFQRTYLPPQCQFVIDTNDINGCCAYEFARADRRYMFTLDDVVSQELFDYFCRMMSSIKMESGAGKLELPSGITFLEGMGVTNVKELNVWDKWQQHDSRKVLNAPIAVLPNGKNIEIDIGDFEQPPVSLVAGMAGSGKSEFLKTWILSLASNYSPEELIMVIIDYKGGSMADSVEALPHVVGKITNIETGDIMRPLASLSYEIDRREKIIHNKGITDYKEYAAGFREGKYSEALPMLLIVCDEFAELKLQHRDFMTELVRVARLGRSVGIRLILATQSPAGVVDQDLIDNSRFQICLKVQNAAASKSMIERPDAARITQSGRAYLRAGADEIFEMVQSFWTGAPYLGNRGKKAASGNQVRIVDIAGQRIKTVWEEKTRFKSEDNELKAVIRYINQIATQHGIKEMACPWKQELPETLSLPDLHIAGCFDGRKWSTKQDLNWLEVPVGLFDIPEKQAQGIQFLNFESDGHFGIYGISGSGKTTMLKTIIMGMSLFYSPEDVNVFIVDLNSNTLKVFESLPHVGGVALGSEEEKLKKMASVLEQLLLERKQIFAKAGVSSLKNYRESISKEMAAIIIAIDNLLPLFEVCPEFESLLYKIANEGASYGLYLVYTSNNTNGIRFKLLQNIHGGIAFQMGSKGDYNDIVGKVDRPEVVQKVKGRGFVKESTPVVFQAALYGVGSNEIERNEWCKSIIAQMSQCWDKGIDTAIKSVPETLSVYDMAKHYVQRDFIPVGLFCEDASPAYLDCHSNYCNVIVGKNTVDADNAIRATVKLIAESQFQNYIYIIDSSEKRTPDLIEIADEYVRSDDLNAVDDVLNSLIKILVQRQTEQKDELEKHGDRFDTSQWIGQYPQYVIFINDLKEVVDLADKNNRTFGRLNALLGKAAGLGLIVIAATNADDMKAESQMNPIFSRLVNSHKGLAISGSPWLHNYFECKNLSFEQKKTELQNGFALLYSGGTVNRVKLMEG